MSLNSLLDPHRRWMQQALFEAQRAFEDNEVPVGAIIVRDGRLVGRGRNQVERLNDPTAHAEMLAITAATQTLESKFLDGCTMYVTLEPCPMCSGALIWSRISRLVFGAFDEKAGCCSTLYNLVQDTNFNHQVEVISGVEADASSELMKQFFRTKRSGKV